MAISHNSPLLLQFRYFYIIRTPSELGVRFVSPNIVKLLRAACSTHMGNDIIIRKRVFEREHLQLIYNIVPLR